MATLHLMMGAPGSGKSTWCKNHMTSRERYVSRDDVRFSLVSENEEYFSREKEVFRHFTGQINFYLMHRFDVFADATHITKASRNKLLRSIFVDNVDVDIIYIKKPLQQILEQNEKRKGTRAYVPKEVIRRMYNQIEKPEFEEGFSKIYTVEDEKLNVLIKEE